MSGEKLLLAVALRVLPKDDRHRYGPEWRTDLSEAHQLGLRKADVSRGAMRLALRLRLKQPGAILVGRHGVWKAAGCWLILGAAHVVVGPLLVLVPVVAIAALLSIDTPAKTTRHVIAGCSAMWVICVVLFYWSFGLGIEAADNETKLSPWVAWLTPTSLIGGIAAFIAIVVAAVRSPRPPALRTVVSSEA